MFIRQVVTTNRKTKAKYTVHRLVESYHTPRGPRQRVVMHLGTLDLPKTEWPKLAAVLEAKLAGQISLFEQEDPQLAMLANEKYQHGQFAKHRDLDREQRSQDQELTEVDLNSVNASQARSLGPELVAHAAWEQLGLDLILEFCNLSLEQKALAKATIIGRLIAPGSELATWEWLKSRTALLELLPADLSRIGKNQFYEIVDTLLPYKEKIEKALYQKETELFPQERVLFLYDLTNTYFEGRALGNKLAKRGKSKEKRSDCPLVTLALLVDGQGFPVFSQIYEGNQAEPETLADILDRLTNDSQGLFTQNPIIVMDRGLATRDNLNLLKGRKYSYLVIERRKAEKQYVREFETARDEFQPITTASGDTVYLKKLTMAEGSRILCLSEKREDKERAIDHLKEQRFLEDITKLQRTVMTGKLTMAGKVYERVGRLKERYPSIVGHYGIEIGLDETEKKVTAVNWAKKPSRQERATLTGCYVIETELDLTAEETWRTYMTLVNVEAAFRDLKTDLGIRPVHHQLAERTKGHLLISVLAYHLLITIERNLREKGDCRSWGTLKKQLATHQRITVMLTDAKKRIHHLRLSTTPESIHQEIYRLLNVKDPLKRLKRLAGTRL